MNFLSAPGRGWGVRGSRVSDFFYFCGWGGEGGWVRWEGGRVRWGVKGGGE